MLNVAFSELKMKKGKVVLTNRGSILFPMIPAYSSYSLWVSKMLRKNGLCPCTTGA